MSSATIVLETFFLAQVADTARWEERFDVLFRELNDEYGDSFVWSDSIPGSDRDIVFVLYPPDHHQRMVSEQVLANYISSQVGTLTHVHVIVIGRNSQAAKVKRTDVVDIVNAQCIPSGVKAEAFRVLRPEELDDEVRTTLVRLHTRRNGGRPRLPDELLFSDSSIVSRSGFFPHPAHERGDL